MPPPINSDGALNSLQWYDKPRIVTHNSSGLDAQLLELHVIEMNRVRGIRIFKKIYHGEEVLLTKKE